MTYLLKSILRKRHWLRTLKEVKIENFDNFFPRGISSKAKEILPQHAMINFSFHLLGSSFLCTILTVALRWLCWKAHLQFANLCVLLFNIAIELRYGIWKAELPSVGEISWTLQLEAYNYLKCKDLFLMTA